jgi:hypothetical protein
MSATVSPVRGPRLARPLHVLSLLATAAALSACGGGGGGGDTSGNVDQPQGVDTPPVTVDPLNSGTGVFHFKVESKLSDDAQLRTAVGGDTYAAWNPTSSGKLVSGGLKLTFFGKANGCNTSNGPVDAGVDADLLAAQSASRVATDSTALRRWAPSGQTTGCTLVSRALSGPSMAYLNPAASKGAVALYTHTGPRADGSDSLMNAFDAAGQNGNGANAHIAGTFFTLRQNWRSETAITPWVGLKTVTSDASARMVTTQGVGAADLGEQSSEVIQAKQQLSMAFINATCMEESSPVKRACQLSYLFNTAIYRNSVSDWSGVSWFQNGKVWFDPAQGGIPIVEVPMKGAGTLVSDEGSGLALYRSQGAATQHAAFGSTTFDARISFDQLHNVLRIVTARKLGLNPADVSAAQLAADWGSRWNDRAAWRLLSTTVGQEVHNPLPTHRATIGGSVSQVYVAPQG